MAGHASVRRVLALDVPAAGWTARPGGLLGAGLLGRVVAAEDLGAVLVVFEGALVTLVSIRLENGVNNRLHHVARNSEGKANGTAADWRF